MEAELEAQRLQLQTSQERIYSLEQQLSSSHLPKSGQNVQVDTHLATEAQLRLQWHESQELKEDLAESEAAFERMRTVAEHKEVLIATLRENIVRLQAEVASSACNRLNAVYVTTSPTSVTLL